MKGALLTVIVPGMVLFLCAACGTSDSKKELGTIDLFSQAVLENPNNAISAAYSIHRTGITSAYVEYRCVDCEERDDRDPEWERTPTFSVGSERFILPVLGLRPESTYTMRAVLTESSGGEMVTDPLSFETGPLPEALDLPFHTSGENPSEGYVLISHSLGSGGVGGYLFALDETGRVAWYTRNENTWMQGLLGISDEGLPLICVVEGDFSDYVCAVDLFGNVVDMYEVPTFPSEKGITLDGHEFLLSGDDKIFLCGKHYSLDMTPYGGKPDTHVKSNRIRRVSADGTIVFDWGYMDAFPLTDSYTSLDLPVVDWVHANSVDVTDDGHYIVSSRHFCEVTKVDSADGSVIWRLGGKNNHPKAATGNR